jgi:hypothetical protein
MDKKLYEQTVLAQQQSEQAAYKEKQARYPEKPTALLKAALQRFLSETAEVDFAAKLVDIGGHQVFSEDRYEAKPDAWKRAFRAGREATGAAREAAQAWLAELK